MDTQLSLYLFMDELSGQRLARFELLNRNARGVITIEELGTMIRSVGENPTDRELEGIFRASDLDGNGEIDFQEFYFVMAQFENEEDRELCHIFKMFDRNGDGYITEGDLLQLLENTDLKGERKAIRRLLYSVNADNDGHISCDEFMAMMKRTFAYPSLKRKPLKG